jgi:hypothetical protein
LSLRDWFAEWCHGNLLLDPVPGWIDFGCVSPLFFGAIASMPIEDFKTTVKDITPNGVIDQLADQTSDNAKIVAQESGLRPTQHRILLLRHDLLLRLHHRPTHPPEPRHPIKIRPAGMGNSRQTL